MEPERLVFLQLVYEALVKLNQGKTFRCYWQDAGLRRGIDGRLGGKPTRIKSEEKIFDIGLAQRHFDEFASGRTRELRLAVQTVIPFLTTQDMETCNREVTETFLRCRLGVEWNGNPNTFVIVPFRG